MVLLFLVSETDPSFRQVVWRHFHLDPVARQNLDVVHPHFAGDVGRDDVTILQFHSEHGVGQRFEDGPVLGDGRLFRHMA